MTTLSDNMGRRIETNHNPREGSKVVSTILEGVFWALLGFDAGFAQERLTHAYDQGLENKIQYTEQVPLNKTQVIPSQENKKQSKYSREDYVKAIVEIESNGNPNAERYEFHINDTSYGLGQILTRTAKDREKKNPNLPRLGESPAEIKKSLCNPEINKAYIMDIFQEELDFYEGNASIAVAAYNSGHLTPRNARVQEQINELFNSSLKTDGVIGTGTKKSVKEFQARYNLKQDGRVRKDTYFRLQGAWKEKYSDKFNPKGIIPINKYTPNHVRKFNKALEKR